ncbi:hypothetical protein L3N51_02067 [Metallosphaera sp. J1]|nr:hypothetical protein [Metallosphaera javensis (ex Hofmann et al. 2022)]
MARRGRKPVYRDVPCPSCGSNHVVKNGKIRGRQFYLCRECGRKFVEGAKHHHDRSVRERALRMYANGMSMRSPGYFRSHWARYSRGSRGTEGRSTRNSWGCGGEPGTS